MSWGGKRFIEIFEIESRVILIINARSFFVCPYSRDFSLSRSVLIISKDSNEAESGLLPDTYFPVCQDGRNDTKVYKKCLSAVVRECGVGPLPSKNVSKSPKHIYKQQSTLSNGPETSLDVSFAFFPF